MAKVQHYRGLNTNLDKLYNNIKQLLENQKDLQIVSEYKGTLNAVPLRSIVAINKSPKVWVPYVKFMCPLQEIQMIMQ